MKTGKPIDAAVDPAGALARVREQIADLKRQQQQAEDAPVPRAVAIERIDRLIERLSARQAERCLASQFMGEIEQNVDLMLPFQEHRGVGVGNGIDQLLAWIAPALIRERLVGDVDLAYASAPEAGMTPTDRAKRAETLKAELFAAEVEEERIVSDAEQRGLIFNRRHDADPAAILAA